jgi:hypothetical protein
MIWPSIRKPNVYIEFELLQVKIPIVFLATACFSLRSEGYYLRINDCFEKVSFSIVDHKDKKSRNIKSPLLYIGGQKGEQMQIETKPTQSQPEQRSPRLNSPAFSYHRRKVYC